ncbi:hypothetical protein M432DRAFT_641808 [Thermoascus aurantiacus ATCC 26904]
MSSGEESSMRPSKLQPEDAQRRPTAPLRWLLNDLPSAHTSIPRVQGPKIPSPSPGLMNSDDPFAHLPRCRDLPRTPAHLIRPGPLYNQPGQVQAFPFDSQSAGSPPTALEEDETVLNASTPATTHNRSSKTSLSSVKSLTEKFAKIFVKPLKQVDAAKDRVCNKFLAPRPKLSRTESIHRKPKKLSKKTGESKPGVSAESGERDKNNLVCQSARPLNRDLNQNQPNFHGARGRVEKSTAINDVIRKGSVKGSKTRFGKDPVWAAARRRQSVSIPEEFQIPNSDSEETDSEDRSIDEEVQRKARIGLIGETPETPLPSVTERLNASNEGHESPLQIARPSSSSGHIHHLNRHEAPLHMNPVTSGHPHEHAENDIGEPGPAIHEDQGWDDGSSQPGQGAGPNATGHNAVPFNPFVNQGSTGTSPAFIPKRRATFSGLPLNDNLGASTAAPSTAANSVTRNSARASKRKPSDAQVRERLRAMDTVVLADIARPRASVLLWDLQGSSPRRQGTTAANGDEETACSSPAVWYWSSPGYVFPEPPRLSQAPQRHAQASTMSNIVVQRRLGRVLLGVLSLLPLAGWIVVTLIGLGVSGPDRLMKWYSRGVVDSFHDRERRLARWACGIYVVALLVAVFVPTVVVLVVRAR